MLLIERIYNHLFSGIERDAEWFRWHEETRKKISDIHMFGVPPAELSDPTEIKYYTWLTEEILNLINRIPNTILEVGGGSGALSFYLQEETDAKCTIVDNSNLALEYASLVFRESRAAFIKGDATNLPIKSESYDFVHSIGLIEHFSDEVIYKMIKEMIRVTKSSGLIYVAVPNYFSTDLISIWRRCGKGTERYITSRRLASYLDIKKVRIVHYGHCQFMLNARSLIPRKIEAFLGKAGLGFLNFVLCEKC